MELEWAGDIRWACEQVDRMHLAVQSGLWRPTRAHLEYARAVHQTFVAEPDHPPLPFTRGSQLFVNFPPSRAAPRRPLPFRAA